MVNMWNSLPDVVVNSRAVARISVWGIALPLPLTALSLPSPPHPFPSFPSLPLQGAPPHLPARGSGGAL